METMETLRYEHAEDGWVYENDKRLRKWFSYISSEKYSHRVKVWRPILRDIAAIERRCKLMVDRWNKFAVEHYRPMFDLMVAAQQAHAKPTHKFNSDKKWRLYKASEYGVGFDWVDEPTVKINYDLGQKFYETDYQMMRYGGYVYTFKTVLAYVIDKMLDKDHKPESAGTTMKLTINGRIFWYVSVQHQHYIGWEKISWPYSAKDELIEAEIGG